MWFAVGQGVAGDDVFWSRDWKTAASPESKRGLDGQRGLKEWMNMNYPIVLPFWGPVWLG